MNPGGAERTLVAEAKHASNRLPAAGALHAPAHLARRHADCTCDVKARNRVADNEQLPLARAALRGRGDAELVARAAAVQADTLGGEQLAAVANSSLTVLLHGAEIGPVWLGLRADACAGLVFPYLCEETLAWWTGGPLGLRIAPFYEAPVRAADERFGLPAESAEDIIAIYNRDLRVEPKRLENALWCADARAHW